MVKALAVAEAEKQLLAKLTEGETPAFYVELPRPVGVDILETVSSDLYKNPFHVVRELIQNSYDEEADNVELLVTGGCIVVKDNGRGMDFRALASTRRLSESDKVYNPQKYPNPVRGFRKLGIYSGYQIARGLELRTKQANLDYEMSLYLDFERMRSEVLKNRTRSENARWDFRELVEQCTYIKGAKTDPENVNFADSYTIAQLVDVERTNPDAWARVSDEDELAKYVVETFSLDFDTAFKHRAKIHAHLKKYVPGFHPFTINLCTQRGEELLRRPAITDVDAVTLFRLPKNSDLPIAVGWIGRRSDRALDDRSARGIAFKVGGITIGPKTAGREGASSDHYYFYDRLTGEIHVIDPDIKPDPERASFNPSPKTDELYRQCNALVNNIVADAREDRTATTERTKAERKVKKLVGQWAALKPKLDEPTSSQQAIVNTAIEVASCLKELKSAQLSVSENLAREAAKNVQEMEATVARAFGTIQVQEKGTRPASRRGATSLLGCLSPDELSSAETLLRFLTVVDTVIKEQLSSEYRSLVQLVRVQWSRQT